MLRAKGRRAQQQWLAPAALPQLHSSSSRMPATWHNSSRQRRNSSSSKSSTLQEAVGCLPGSSQQCGLRQHLNRQPTAGSSSSNSCPGAVTLELLMAAYQHTQQQQQQQQGRHHLAAELYQLAGTVQRLYLAWSRQTGMVAAATAAAAGPGQARLRPAAAQRVRQLAVWQHSGSGSWPQHASRQMQHKEMPYSSSSRRMQQEHQQLAVTTRSRVAGRRFCRWQQQ